MNFFIDKVKQKKEFSQLPNSIIEKALLFSKNDIGEARAFLRKYFGVFLTNKVLKLNNEDILKSHISSKYRDYENFYKKLFEGRKDFRDILDIGCGVNGFSYGFLKNLFENVKYIGIEAVGQIVEKTNHFFKEKGFSNAKILQIDLFNLSEVEKIIKEMQSPKAIFLFQIIDALEAFEKDYSKKILFFIKNYLNKEDVVFISMPMKSLSGKKKFEARRTWLKKFLEENFKTEELFLGDERVFTCEKKVL